MENSRINTRLSDYLDDRGFPLHDDIIIVNAFKPARKIGDVIYVSSATPLQSDQTEITGKVGKEIDNETASVAACLCVSHSLSLLQKELGKSLNEIDFNIVDLTFFINSSADFDKHSEVVDNASDLLIEGLGKNGEHSRSAIGVYSLVRNVSVVLKAVYQVMSS